VDGDRGHSGRRPVPCLASVERWLGRAAVSLMFARAHAAAADPVCCAGMLADAGALGVEPLSAR
jgi:hypothetical protein